MSMFKNMTNNGLEETQDRLGGFQPLATDIYTGVLKLAYATTASSGAQAINFVFETQGKEYRETVYITNKKGENFFLNKDDKTKKVPLPGFVIADDICLCATEKPLSEQEVEEKVVKLYDFEAKKELPKSVPVLVELIGKTVSLGIVQELHNKTKKNDSTGEYEPIEEEVTKNVIEKVFHTESKFTMVEVRNGAETAAFWDAWVERNKGSVKDKRDLKNGKPGAPGKPAPAGSGQTATPAAARKSLFGAKK